MARAASDDWSFTRLATELDLDDDREDHGASLRSLVEVPRQPVLDLHFEQRDLADVIANESGFAAMLAGHNARDAASPLPARAHPGSTMRSEQLGDLRHAHAWASGQLGLPVPDGPIA